MGLDCSLGLDGIGGNTLKRMFRTFRYLAQGGKAFRMFGM